MNNTEFSNLFSFNIYRQSKSYITDNSKNAGAPKNFIGYMLKGSLKLKSRESVIGIHEDDVFFIPKNQLYQSHWFLNSDGKIEFLSLGADNLPLPESIKFTLQKINCNNEDKDILKEFLKDSSTNCKTVSLFYNFLDRVTTIMERKITHNELIIEKALDFMYSNNDYQIKDIARYCDVSEATIYNIFSKNLHKTPNEIKQQILCEKAVKLLATTTLSVEEISSELQFSSSSYFRKTLKKHTNKTPLQIRKDAFL